LTLLHNLNDSHGADQKQKKKNKKTKAASAPSIQNSSGFKLCIASAPKKSVLEIIDTISPYWDDQELNAEEEEVDQRVDGEEEEDGDGDGRSGSDDEEEEEDPDEPTHPLTPKSLKRKRTSKKDEGESSMQYNTPVLVI
jgi:hypothetical protein